MSDTSEKHRDCPWPSVSPTQIAAAQAETTQAIRDMGRDLAKLRLAIYGNGNTEGSLVSRVAGNTAALKTTIRWGLAIVGIAGVGIGTLITTVIRHLGG
jgi:hypothetical protein